MLLPASIVKSPVMPSRLPVGAGPTTGAPVTFAVEEMTKSLVPLPPVIFVVLPANAVRILKVSLSTLEPAIEMPRPQARRRPRE